MPQHALAGSRWPAAAAWSPSKLKARATTLAALSEALRLFTLAPSLGGVESLVSIPVLTSHLMVPAEERDKMGVTEQMMRLSVGIENADDLIADLEHALKAVPSRQTVASI